jgi:hypothetical protein
MKINDEETPEGSAELGMEDTDVMQIKLVNRTVKAMKDAIDKCLKHYEEIEARA